MSKKAKPTIQPGSLIELMQFGEKVTAVVTSTENGEVKARRIAGAEFPVANKDLNLAE